MFGSKYVLRRKSHRRWRCSLVLYLAESLEPRVLLAIPHIGSADAAPNPIAPGGALTLTARDVTGTIDELDFYRESNGSAGLQTATDTLVDFATPGAGGIYSATDPAPFTPGAYTYYAIAYSDAGQKSNVVTFQNTVETPPTITSF